MLSAVLFDLDGTLLDTLRDLRDALNFALNACSLPSRSLEETRAFVGNGIPKLIERGVPAGASAELRARVQAAFMPYYAEHCRDHTRPYDGVGALLRALKKRGIRVGVVSNKAEPAVKALCEAYFPGLIDAAAGGRPDVPKKPAPDAVLRALRELGVRAEETVYVGDSEVDVETAENAGLRLFAVGWGFRTPGQLFAAGAREAYMTADSLASALMNA